MLRRVNPIVLLSLILALVLALAILAGAQGGGGTAGEALAAAEGQVGKPFVMATDGPDTFSCVGLMRYALRTAGVDPDAPWSPEAYLGKYAPVDPGNLQPGDIVIFPNWATMYVGNGMVVNANEIEGVVTHTPMDVAGTPLGIVRPPYGGSSQPAATDPALDNTMIDPALEGTVPAEQAPLGGVLPEQVPLGGALPEQVPLGGALPEQVPLGGALPEQVPLGGALPDPAAQF